VTAATARIDRKSTAAFATSRYGRAALQGELAQLEAAPEGHRHHDLFVAALHLGSLVAGGELCEAQAEADLIDAAQLIGLHASEARRQVRNGLRKGKARPRRAPREGLMVVDGNDARLRAAEGLSEVLAHRWTGRQGNDVRVLAAVYLRAIQVGTLDLSLSYRQLAELAGVGHVTCGRVLQRHDGSWLRITHVGSRHAADDATTIRLKPGAFVKHPEGDARGSGGALSGCFTSALHHGGPITRPNADPWQRRPNAWRIYLALLAAEGPLAASQLQALGLSRRAAYGNLAYLEANGLAARTSGGWVAVPPDEATDRWTADLGGFTWMLERRRERYRRDRLGYRDHLERRRQQAADAPPPDEPCDDWEAA
jgi:hypothetical protein